MAATSPHPSPAVAAAVAPALGRRRPRRAPRSLGPHAAPRHREVARVGLPGPGAARRGRRVRTGARGVAAAAGARRRRGGRARRRTVRGCLDRSGRIGRAFGAGAGEGHPSDARPAAATMNALRTVTVPGSGGGAPRAEDGVEPEVLTVVAMACRDSERLEFGYTSADGTRTDRCVEPFRLVPLGRRWYLVAWDPARGDWRVFRLDRVTGPRAAGGRFAPRRLPADDAAAFVRERNQRGVRGLPGRGSVRCTGRRGPPTRELVAVGGGRGGGTVQGAAGRRRLPPGQRRPSGWSARTSQWWHRPSSAPRCARSPHASPLQAVRSRPQPGNTTSTTRQPSRPRQELPDSGPTLPVRADPAHDPPSTAAPTVGGPAARSTRGRCGCCASTASPQPSTRQQPGVGVEPCKGTRAAEAPSGRVGRGQAPPPETRVGPLPHRRPWANGIHGRRRRVAWNDALHDRWSRAASRDGR